MYDALKPGDIVALSWWDNPEIRVAIESLEDPDSFIDTEPGTLALYLGKVMLSRRDDAYPVDVVMSQGFVGWVYDDEMTPQT
jgi:hypothetical protein